MGQAALARVGERVGGRVGVGRGAEVAGPRGMGTERSPWHDGDSVRVVGGWVVSPGC